MLQEMERLLSEFLGGNKYWGLRFQVSGIWVQMIGMMMMMITILIFDDWFIILHRLEFIEPSTSSGTMKWSQLTNWGTAGNFIINGSKSISLEQPSPRQVGFDTIDAILPGPMYGKGAYLFSWEKYALVYFELGMLLGDFFSLILGRVNNMDTRSSPQSGHHWTKLFSWLWIWFSFILRTRIKFSRDYYVFILGPVYCPQTLYVKECADHQ